MAGSEVRGTADRADVVIDRIIVGRGTAAADDPQLTARPGGPRIATRVVLDTHAQLSSQSRLVRTAREVPVLVIIGPEAGVTDSEVKAARRAGVRPVSLGPRILRTETAAMVMVSQILFALEH